MTRRNTILIADDDPSLCLVLTTLLEEEGFGVLQAADGIECLRMAYEHHPDLVLLDITMPNRDGREVCRRLREISRVPIIMLTAVSAEAEKVARLGEGADDYITKPFHNDELVARILAVLRRLQPATDAWLRYDDGFLEIDFKERRVRVNGAIVSFSPKEWRLLECFIRQPNKIISRQTLLHFAWGEEYENDFRSLKVFISHLRRKINDPARRAYYIHTERELGYRFESHN